MVTQANNVWLPDVALINCNDVYSISRDSRFPVTITANGQVLFVPAGKIHARCELDLRYFPFDWQVSFNMTTVSQVLLFFFLPQQRYRYATIGKLTNIQKQSNVIRV